MMIFSLVCMWTVLFQLNLVTLLQKKNGESGVSINVSENVSNKEAYHECAVLQC